jgi:group II intron reverse transcriptase/maturase
MQSAETILAVIQERGRRGLPLERVYRLLFIPEFYPAAYGKLYGNKGAMTPGTTGETVDGMSAEKIRAIIDLIRQERSVWTPARRVNIPKANGKTRPLGIPSWSDKLLQEVMRTIMEAYYEPQFAGNSHGFRPGRGTHTALREIKTEWTGTAWFIEGDIKGCCDNISHATLLEILKRKIHDGRFLQLLSNMLKAGYMEEWTYHKTRSGTPQGGVISPLLANIYMSELDQFVNEKLLTTWNRGKRRKYNPAYRKIEKGIKHLEKAGRKEDAKEARKTPSEMPSVNLTDQNYRRLKYVRYADDFLLGLAGTRKEAEHIKEETGKFLKDNLQLELSQEKTLVTHARTDTAIFLGYGIAVLQANSYRSKDSTSKYGPRTLNGTIGLKVPDDVVQKKCRQYMRNGKPIHRKALTENSDYAIVDQYQAEYRGLVEYYRLAFSIRRLGLVRWIMERSLTMTLANKHKTSVKAIYKKYRAKVKANGRQYLALQVVITRKEKIPLVATWGGIPLTYLPAAQITDDLGPPPGIWLGRTELVQRLLANECDYCGSKDDIEVHHVRGLKDLKSKGRTPPAWVRLMAARKRKTMVLCRICHQDVTYGRPMRNTLSGRGFMQKVTDHAHES